MIRTCDFFVPNEALYQAELRPGLLIEPLELGRGFPTVAVSASDFAFFDLSHNPGLRDCRTCHFAQIAMLDSPDVIEL